MIGFIYIALVVAFMVGIAVHEHKNKEVLKYQRDHHYTDEPIEVTRERMRKEAI